jgi:hypothetical protein
MSGAEPPLPLHACMGCTVYSVDIRPAIFSNDKATSQIITALQEVKIGTTRRWTAYGSSRFIPGVKSPQYRSVGKHHGLLQGFNNTLYCNLVTVLLATCFLVRGEDKPTDYSLYIINFQNGVPAGKSGNFSC